MPSNLLTARKVETIKTDGVYADGDGLYLRARGSGRHWIFVFTWHSKRREMGLGKLAFVSLARAREKAQDARNLLAEGKDPVAEKRTQQGLQTFGEVADDWITGREGSVSGKSVDRWRRCLGAGGYADKLRAMRVSEITTERLVDDVLKPIWHMGPTATLARAYVESVLDAAAVRAKLRDYRNPARWKGHLEHILPKPEKLSKGHHAAMPYDEAPSFMADLRVRDGIPARALEVTVLAALRTDSSTGGRWAEVDFTPGHEVWVIPAERMKGKKAEKKPLTVPLLGRALEIMKALRETAGENPFIFPSTAKRKQKTPCAISNMAMEMVMRRMGYGESKPDYTVHGFRSTFKDYCGDRLDFADEVSEAALGHAVGSAARRAYRRGEALDKRRALMKAWDQFCASGALAAAA